MKKNKYILNVIYYNLSFLNGNLFYGFEYLVHLNENLPGFDFKLVLEINQKVNKPEIFISEEIVKEKLFEKYDEKIVNKYLKDVIITNNFNNFFKINLLILDQHSLQYAYKFMVQNLFINWGDHEQSLKIPFKNSKYYKRLKNNITNFIIFGDKEIGCKVDIHEPLKLNFSIFKKIKSFKNNTWYEIKDHNIFNRKRNIKNFHETFNKLYFEKRNFWERANRLIPECKFYNKEIIFKNFDNWIDSADLRYKRSWQEYNLKNSNIVNLIKKYNKGFK